MAEIPPSRLLLPRPVRDKEREYIEQRRTAADLLRLPKAGEKLDLKLADGEKGKNAAEVGIALSGGGIRSATFALGALQGMARHGVLRLADYMSTVSGGGYIGSCLSSLMSVREIRDGDDRDEGKHGHDLGEKLPLSHPDQIHHLRWPEAADSLQRFCEQSAIERQRIDLWFFFRGQIDTAHQTIVNAGEMRFDPPGHVTVR